MSRQSWASPRNLIQAWEGAVAPRPGRRAQSQRQAGRPEATGVRSDGRGERGARRGQSVPGAPRPRGDTRRLHRRAKLAATMRRMEDDPQQREPGRCGRGPARAVDRGTRAKCARATRNPAGRQSAPPNPKAHRQDTTKQPPGPQQPDAKASARNRIPSPKRSPRRPKAEARRRRRKAGHGPAKRSSQDRRRRKRTKARLRGGGRRRGGAEDARAPLGRQRRGRGAQPSRSGR